MKTLRTITVAAAGLALLAPTALAGSADSSVDTATPPPTATTTTVPTPAAAVTPPATTTVTPPPATTTVTSPPATTTTTAPPATTTTTTATVPTTTPITTPTTTGTTTTTTTTDGDGVDGIPDDIEAAGCSTAIGAADCIPDTATVGTGTSPYIGRGNLPFTGIGDSVAPVLLALVVLLAGIVAIRWAQLREAVARGTTRRMIDAPVVTTRTGFADPLREQQLNARARRFFSPHAA